jgi:Zn-dependent protease with chaperone function
VPVELSQATPRLARVRTKVWASAAALAGFFAVAALQLALVVVPVLLVLAALPGDAVLRLGVPVGTATVGVMAYATWQALRTRRPEPVGIPVTRTDAPELWALLDGAAAATGTRAPDRLTIVADAAARLIERSRWLGLIGGRRDFYLGLPLLQAWNAEHLRAVAAHELAHFSPRLSRLAPLAWRGRVTVARVVPRIPRRNPAGPLLRAWAKVYRRLDAPFSRAQELQADRIAAEYAGTRAAASVLRDLPALDALQRVFLAEYLGPGWQAGHVPDDIFGGFLRVLAARADEISLLRTREPAPPSAWDTHPPLKDRLAALTDRPTPPTVALSPAARSAVELSAAVTPSSGTRQAQPSSSPSPTPSSPSPTAPADPPPSAAGTPSTTESFASPGDSPLSAVTGSSPPGAASPVSSVASASSHGDASSVENESLVSGTAGDEPGGAEPSNADIPEKDLVPDLPGLGRALQQVAYPPQGRTPVGWDEFFGAARTVEMQREADAALQALTRAAGTPVTTPSDVLDLAADGRLRKLAEAVFTDLPPDETEARTGELVTLLLALAALRAGAARWRHSWLGTAELVAADGSHLDLGTLSARAVDPATAAEARERLTALGIDITADPSADAPPPRPEVVGGVVNLVVDGARTDLLIVDTGLLLVPGLPRTQNTSAKRRLAQFAAADPAQPGPTTRFIPYADVATATQPRRRTWSLGLRDGATLTLRAGLDSDELPGGWSALDQAVAYLSRR